MTKQTQKVLEEATSKKMEIFNVETMTADLKGLIALNIEAVDNGNILAVFDSGGMDTATVDAEAASWVVEKLVGSLCYNVEDGIIKGNKMIADAEDQQKRAALRDIANHDAKSQDYLESRQTWLCRQMCQQEFRKNLRNLTHTIYKEFVGVEYVFAKTAIPTGNRDTAAQSVSQKLAALKAAK